MYELLAEGRPGRETEEECWAIFDELGRPEIADAEFLAALGPLVEAPHPGNAERFWAAHGFHADLAHPLHFEKHGRWYHGSLRQVQDRVVARLEDVTERFAAQLHRRKFLSVAAHDVRGPLANVRSYASLLLSPRMALDERTQKAVKVMGRNTDRALHLIHALFELWKDELGPLAVDPQLLPLAPLLADAETEARALALPLEVGLESHIPDSLPELRFDPERLRLAVDAFWRNALGRSTAGGVVRSEVEDLPREVRISFWDQGPQLTGEEMAHAFDRDFVVSHARKLDSRFELCLGAAFVRAHGGAASVRQEQAGTAFSFTVPKAIPHPGPEPGGQVQGSP